MLEHAETVKKLSEQEARVDRLQQEQGAHETAVQLAHRGKVWSSTAPNCCQVCACQAKSHDGLISCHCSGACCRQALYTMLFSASSQVQQMPDST